MNREEVRNRQMPSAARAPFLGTPYRAIRHLGTGGMGDVFLVEHVELERQFVAKVLRAEFARHPQLVDRMRLEGQALGRLSHPNIVEVTGFERTADGRPILIMEYLRGRTLRDELRLRSQLPVAEAVRYARELLAALTAAHRIGIVHRDIKPSNLFLCEAPGKITTLKVLDFGVARVLPSAPKAAPPPLSVPTTTGAVVGTPRFTSPEGAAGKRVDERADLYGAGLVLYAMLSGRGPFDDIPKERDVLDAHARRTPEPPSAHAGEPVAAELDQIVLKALAKAPDERFQSADEFSAALERVGALLARPVGWLETTTFDAKSVAPSPRGNEAPYPRSLGHHGVRSGARDIAGSHERTRSSVGYPRAALLLAFFAALVLTGLAVAAVVVTLRGGR